MSAEDIRLCVVAGAQALGFVVAYPVDVPWNIDRLRARALMRSVPSYKFPGEDYTPKEITKYVYAL